MSDLHEKIKQAKNLTEAYDALMNAIGSEAWGVLEKLMMAQDVKERRAVQREMSPWSQLDIDLLERLVGFAKTLPQQGDPIKPYVRLEGMIESMKEVKLIGERGY